VRLKVTQSHFGVSEPIKISQRNSQKLSKKTVLVFCAFLVCIVVDFEPKKSWIQAPNRPEKKKKKSKFCQAIRNQNQNFHGFNPESTTETSGQNFVRDFERPKFRVLHKTYEIPTLLAYESASRNLL
jgi:hypothetical protein